MYCLLYQNTYSAIMLLDSPEDVDLAQILVFSNISIFLGLHWPWKWTKNFKFWYVPFQLKFEFFERLFKSCFFLHEAYLQWKFDQDWTDFLPFFKTTRKTIPYLLHYFTLHHWSKFQSNLTSFEGVLHWKQPKTGPRWLLPRLYAS